MNPNESQPPLPCGEGAGGEGRSDAAPLNERAQKRGHGYAPAFGEERQKDHARVRMNARRLRKDMTPSEKVLWKLLRGIEGQTFRRQVPIGNYVFDFGHYSARLLIEIDGSIHRLPEVQARDREKEICAIATGFRVLRFANNDPWDRPAWVLDQVRARLAAPRPPTPSPQGRGGDDF